jgi:hypothetical protein
MSRAAESAAPDSRIKTLSRDEFEERKLLAMGRPTTGGGPSTPTWKTSNVAPASEFPSLPKAVKPVKPGRPGASNSGNAWSASSDPEPESSGTDGKKGKKAKKEILFKIGL